MASRFDPCLECRIDDLQIVIECLLSVHSEFIEYMIVRAACEYSGLSDVHLLNDLEILFLRSDPGRDLWEFKTQILTCPDRFLVSVTVCEEFSLTDYTFRT